MNERLTSPSEGRIPASPATARSPGAGTLRLRVEGMDCPSCAAGITRALENVDGIEEVRVDVMGGRVQVRHDGSAHAFEPVASAIRGLGYAVREERIGRSTFHVDGLCCAHEIKQIEGALAGVPGVEQLHFDVMNARLIVEGSTAPAEVQRAIGAIGMIARVEGEKASAAPLWQRHGPAVMAALSALLLAVGLVLQWLSMPRALEVATLAGSTLAGGWFIAPRAFRAAMRGVLDMNVLMTLATIGAAVIGEWSEGASVMFLFAVAQRLEAYSMDRARNAIAALVQIAPSEGTVRRGGRELALPVSAIGLGDILIVRPGQRIPLDGVVTTGASSVNQAAITGESIPVDKSDGDDVFAGTVNAHGVLEVRVTKLVEDTTLARIVHAVEEAQASRAPSQGFVDRFARVYTPVVVLAAVMIAVVPPVLGLGTWETWFYRALAMLVIACPCALVISTPVSIVSGLAGAARAGVLIKGGMYLEHAATASVIAFDKTGTLTEGRPSLIAIRPFGATETEVLRLAAALEHNSEHPLARAVLQAAAERHVDVPAAQAFEALPGRGVRATVETRALYLGNERMCEGLGVGGDELSSALAELESAGQTAVVLTTSQQVLGVLAIADRVRADALQAVQALRAAGLRRIVMLTGDNEGTARAVAQQLSISEYRARLLPEEKVAAIRDLEASGERVVFVGDGVNDAPALAVASVGVAMGVAGTDVALETADVALMADDLSKLAVAIGFSRKTLRIIKQNIAFSLANKAVFLILALGGWATLWMAVASDMGASLVVILNGLRALRAER